MSNNVYYFVMDNLTATCAKCSKQFYIINREQEFLRQKGLPNPTWCPSCRQERRLSLRGSRRELFKTTCQKCGKSIVVAFDPKKVTNPVYCREDYDKYFAEHDSIVNEPLPQV